LREIGLYIARDNPVRAETFVLELREVCHKVAAHPQSFPIVAHHRASGLRHRSHKRYVIFYRVGDDAVEIVRVLHGARDWGRLLFPNEAE
jgi:toxin ParE1/3/4